VESKFNHGDGNKNSTSESASASLSIHLSGSRQANISRKFGCETVPSPFNDIHVQTDNNRLFENSASMPFVLLLGVILLPLRRYQTHAPPHGRRRKKPIL